MELSSLKEIFAPFESFNGRAIPRLLQPYENIEVSQDRLGGVPILTGTRITYDLVTSLLEGEVAMTPEEIVEMYPSAHVEGIRSAIDFDRAVRDLSA